MGQGPAEGTTYRYFLSSRGRRSPAWLWGMQWTALVAWLAFSLWLLAGSGKDRIVAAAYPVNGIFAGEVGLLWMVVPIWGLVSLAVAALLLWTQILWRRCRMAVAFRDGEWRWTGRRGPRKVAVAAPTAGGTWCQDGPRWFYVAKGFVDEDGQDWSASAGGERASLLCPRRLMSPLAVLLAALLAGAYLLERPLSRYRHLRVSVAEAVWSGDSEAAESTVRAYPPFRPWLRYLSSIRACDRADCLRSQLTDRLEMTSIGPEYSADATSLYQLLVLAGRSRLAIKLVRPESVAAVELAVRLDRPAEARAILADAGDTLLERRVSLHGMLLLEEGRFEEAYELISQKPPPNYQRSLALRAVLAYLTGRCAEAESLAGRLMAPDSLDQARLDGEAPATGLGALQRASRRALTHASRAVAVAILGWPGHARNEWLRASDVARDAGVPGVLDVDRVLLSRLLPGTDWLGHERQATTALTGPRGRNLGGS